MAAERNDAARSRWFTRLAGWASLAAGRPATFAIAVVVLVGWAIVGPLFDFSDSWQLVVNTGTTIVTFLMVFLIQHTQTRDTTAIHIKLDELIRVTENARNALIPLEDLDDVELDNLRRDLEALARRAGEPPRGERRRKRDPSSGASIRPRPERAD